MYNNINIVRCVDILPDVNKRLKSLQVLKKVLVACYNVQVVPLNVKTNQIALYCTHIIIYQATRPCIRLR